MSHKISKVKAITLMALATTLLLPLSAPAQETNDDEWNIVIGMYVWLPDISGTTVFPSGESGPDIEVGADTILKNLDFTFMGALQAKRGRWGFLTDLIYLNEGASESGVRDFSVGPDDRPAGVELDASMDLKSWVVTLAGIYELHSNGRSTTDLIFGTRMLDVDSTLDWSFTGNIDGLELPGPSGSSSVGGTNWDAIVGLRGHAYFGSDERWFLPYHFDAGTGDSDLTWQAMAGVGYRFDWGSMVLNWRHLDYDAESGASLGNISFSGPLLGAAFHW